MTHYRMTNKKPSAIITVDGNEKKIYAGNQIFLKNGENFEIRFFNPLNEKIGVEILFNGQKKNDGFLIIRPGEDVTLDRFLNEKKKMTFETYNIDSNNLNAIEASKMNGLIEFKFYKEINRNSNIYIHYNNHTTTNPYPTNPYPTNPYPTNPYPTNPYPEYPIVTYNTNTSYKSTFHYDNISDMNNIETGRIEKGQDSKQEMKNVDIVFENKDFYSITYYIKPNSLKTISEIRNYCSKCGYRLRKKSWKFCPICGNELD